MSATRRGPGRPRKEKVPPPQELHTSGLSIITPTWRARIADPKPAFCSGCLRGADAGTIFVDLWMPIERGFLREYGSNAVIAELNRLVLCEGCVREMSECLHFEPSLHRSQQRRIEEVGAERDRLHRENILLRQLALEAVTSSTISDDEGWDDESWDREKD